MNLPTFAKVKAANPYPGNDCDSCCGLGYNARRGREGFHVCEGYDCPAVERALALIEKGEAK